GCGQERTAPDERAAALELRRLDLLAVEQRARRRILRRRHAVHDPRRKARAVARERHDRPAGRRRRGGSRDGHGEDQADGQAERRGQAACGGGEHRRSFCGACRVRNCASDETASDYAESPLRSNRILDFRSSRPPVSRSAQWAAALGAVLAVWLPDRMDAAPTLARLLDDALERRPDEPAVVCGDHATSFAELRELSLRLAGAFAAAGLRGERVATLLPNGVEL